MNSFPKELFFKIEQNQSMELRITVNLGTGDDPYWAEIDLVESENKKIMVHIGTVTGLEDEKEATQRGLGLYKKWRVS